MDRVLASDFDIAVFTNLSQDHLDFHKSMEEYFRAKALLFENLGKSSTAVLNRDDPYGQRLHALTRSAVVSYGIRSPADLRARVLSLSIEGTRFEVNGREFNTGLVGEHNVYNFLCAYGAVRALGIADEAVDRALAGALSVPGRFERVGAGSGFHVFVDYAHTPDALERLLDAASSLKRGRIITVFGCGGDRDRGKRPLMGGVVERKSDLAIVTSDNPRTEDPLAIIEDIKKGLGGNNHIVIPDRREAIFRAVGTARADDIVLIAGKGHEDYQILGNRTIHFDDREVAAEAMKSRGSAIT
jgi:UDP-N-acetylmuramoyl-L-alanyl-D-glutamate--2,6-diaminopimelate ligase